MNISEFCIRRPVFAAVLSALLVIFGLVSLDRLPLREYPDINRPVVSINTIYRGASASIVENKITQVIEDRIAGIEGILKIESDSEDERSNIRIEFDVERDIDDAANDIRDRISRVVAQLPPEAEPPQIAKADSTAEAVMYLAFNSENMTELEVTDYAERYILDRFSTVPGVARASLGGARRAAMRIWIDRQALAARALTVGDIESALRRENVQLPAGRIESVEREFSLRTEVGLDSVEDFRNLVIGRGAEGHLVRLGEVADIQLAAENNRSLMRTNGRAGVGIGIEAQSKANVLDVVRGVHEEIERLRPELPAGASLDVNIDDGVAIEAALREVLIAVVFAFISVLAVIYGFLGTLRATIIPAVTIPVSVIAAFMALYSLDYSINVLTLLGIVLAIGLVVDDSIVVLENIHRRAELGETPVVAAVRSTPRRKLRSVVDVSFVTSTASVPIPVVSDEIRTNASTVAGAGGLRMETTGLVLRDMHHLRARLEQQLDLVDEGLDLIRRCAARVVLDDADASAQVLGKGGKRRSVPVGEAALRALAAWRASRATLAGPQEVALFVGRRGTRITASQVRSRLKALALSAGLPTHVHPHMLRHSYASHLLQSSGDLRAVQELLGHANISTTQVYTRLDFQHLARVYDAAHPRARRR